MASSRAQGVRIPRNLSPQPIHKIPLPAERARDRWVNPNLGANPLVTFLNNMQHYSVSVISELLGITLLFAVSC